MLSLKIQKGKAEMLEWSSRYCELEATASCTIRAAMHMANCGQRESEHHHNCIVGDSWFTSVKTAEAIHECGHEQIGVIKHHMPYSQKWSLKSK
jgi:hypothetical protein